MSILLKTGEVVEQQPHNSIAFFRLAFRPFFLLGSIFSIVSLLLWAAMLSGKLEATIYGGQLWWHIHEMLFGFVCAIIVGFLLTAVQTWTGVPSIKGAYLVLLVALWLCARIAFFLPTVLPLWLIATIDLIFLPLSAAILAYPIIKAKRWINLMFVPLLLTMAFANATMHCATFIQNSTHLYSASTGMVMLVTLLMCIMGGRVFPMFTANGTKTERVPAIGWLEKLAIGSMLLVAIISLNFLELPVLLEAGIFFTAAFIHSIRAFRWRIWVTWKTPLVWSLHVSYWCIPLGLMLYGLAETTDIVTRSQAMHTLTVGAAGIMILAMISRVSLGHTGRNITVGKVMTLAFVTIFLAFLVRVFGIYWFDNYTHIIFTSTLFWVVAYGCFAALYLPVLTRPRVDGRPG